MVTVQLSCRVLTLSLDLKGDIRDSLSIRASLIKSCWGWLQLVGCPPSCRLLLRDCMIKRPAVCSCTCLFVHVSVCLFLRLCFFSVSHVPVCLSVRLCLSVSVTRVYACLFVGLCFSVSQSLSIMCLFAGLRFCVLASLSQVASKAVVNVQVDPLALVRQYEKEIIRLKQELRMHAAMLGKPQVVSWGLELEVEGIAFAS